MNQLINQLIITGTRRAGSAGRALWNRATIHDRRQGKHSQKYKQESSCPRASNRGYGINVPTPVQPLDPYISYLVFRIRSEKRPSHKIGKLKFKILEKLLLKLTLYFLWEELYLLTNSRLYLRCMCELGFYIGQLIRILRMCDVWYHSFVYHN